ncbi:MAG: hypothetical protein M3Y31_01510 [Gemmatimonadota bacterium]|nr:hypothetical protein [Gemmatimonadota bacterium]
MTRIRLATAALAAALTLTTAACGGDDSTGPSPASDNGVILLRNDSNADIVTVNISPCTSPTWGSDRLGASEIIAPAALRSFPEDPDCYDLRVSTGSKTAYWYDYELESGDTLRFALSPAANDLVSGEAAELLSDRKSR